MDNFIAQEGSQRMFLACPVYEVLYEGNRGGGKTITLLADFCQHVGKGFGSAWTGILFRNTYPQLSDVVAKSKLWFRRWFPGATFNEAKYEWVFPDGERLLFRHMRRPQDYWGYHGHEYPWIGFEELTNWATPECYLSMFSCSRSTMPGMPRKIRATTNPYGAGFNWIKRRFQLPHMRWRVQYPDNEPPRVAINSRLSENKALLSADPEYMDKIRASAKNPAQLKAWLEGSWDITSGGMFDHVWDSRFHVLEPFNIPHSWRIDRSFDWGSSKPFSVGWWAESDGTDYIDSRGRRASTIRGDTFRIAEWYGCVKNDDNVGLRMLARDIAKGIIQRELALKIYNRVKTGIADSSIFDAQNGRSIAQDFVSEKVYWMPANKSPGSRVQGWAKITDMLQSAIEPNRDRPALFVFNTCVDFIRTVPTLPRDDANPDDVNTSAEDHIADETRYRLYTGNKQPQLGIF